ncbi:hypothetical protein GCM10025771_17370 [Niveibacterium umoris]|uniref:Uncharacterized protein n=1 Tax=Niveibacterium umoris TaxID=1193620 RepID=A0A840BPR2_9RHOO|nr:hypothetical protein [Niveibacterium umoris]MBB4014990.1 hypothetical protein [Niveibacterium umoris]
MQESNLFQPPKSNVEQAVPKRKWRELFPHEKAGRIIRLMAILCLVSVVGITGLSASTVLPIVANRHIAPLGLFFIVPAVMAAFVAGQFLLSSAVMRHESWARAVGIVVGVMFLVGFPIGTLAGVYVIWQLVFGWSECDASA